MKSLVGVLLSRWLLSLFGTALLGGLVWCFGPLLPPFDAMPPRLAAIGCLGLAWAGSNLLLARQRQRRDSALTHAVTDAPGAEVAALQQRLARALQQLKAARGSRGYLYEQPWYAIIGPPGAGKTTALRNAGLTFPPEAEGGGKLDGVGGTRLCDWWFTEEAVLIDTAGRYTTQDSDAAVDRAGWEGFLDLLRRTRTRQPLNGVLVGIALSDIALARPAERDAHARAIRQRLTELETRLGVRLPVYALFTKADLIAGFTEFFDDLDGPGRAQVWGTTFAETADPLAGFSAAFQALVARLNARLFDRLQAERDPDRRTLIAGFPSQVASLEPALAAFLCATFGPANIGLTAPRTPFLRGVYLTSGTQEGTPIDRLTGMLSRAFGLDQRRAASRRPVKGRSYFLTRLLRDVVFNEAMLVADRPQQRRRRLVLRATAFTMIGLLSLFAGGLIWRTGRGERQAIAAVAQALQHYDQAAAGRLPDPVGDADLPGLVPLLDQARALPFGYDAPAASAAPAWLPGLAQADKLATAARGLYRHALERALLPRLIWRLEAQLRGALDQPDFLYEATRIYLMLGGQGPLDPALVHVWMEQDWQAAYPGAVPVRMALLRHLDALLADQLPAVPLDGSLVAAARATFGRVGFAQRVYSRLRAAGEAQSLPPWSPREALGAAGATLFVRASGKSLDDGIPGFYTVAGFHQLLLPHLAEAARRVTAESWVLGRNVEPQTDPAQLQALQNGVIQLYEAEYAHAWDGLLGDLTLAPVRSLRQAAKDFYILGHAQSPMRDLLVAIARQLTLSVPPGEAKAGGPGLPGHEIDERYRALRELVGQGPGAPIEQVMNLLNDLQQLLAKIEALAIGAIPPPVGPDDPAAALANAAARLPPPAGGWFAALAASGAALRSGGAKQQTIAAFNGSLGPAALCSRTVGHHFPFDPAATADASLEDFARLFAPGGALDGFFNTQLKPYVAVSGRVLHPHSIDGVAPPVSAADLEQFQRAAAIRELFFAGGGSTPAIRLDITPTGLDKGAKQVILDLDGTEISYTQGATKATQIAWPGPKGMQSVKLTFDPPASLVETGPWALFRLFAHGKIQPGADRFTINFQAGEREASFEIHIAAAGNPFGANAITMFRCPNVQ